MQRENLLRQEIKSFVTKDSFSVQSSTEESKNMSRNIMKVTTKVVSAQTHKGTDTQIYEKKESLSHKPANMVALR